MKITGVIRFASEDAKEIAEALSPDNAGFMECHAEGNCVVAHIEGESPGTVLSTTDDYLMNLSVAEKISQKPNEKH
ncbi:MAG TPA: KEOPS complex subunit Pcc1 [Methanocorpusculum sp.]|nr:KEOPS complex subunit Pcc1 [Methanocorpusculum sp.]